MSSAPIPQNPPNAVTSQRVPVHHRNTFLSRRFGFPDHDHFESLIYNWGHTFIVNGNIDYWELVSLSNQGLYLFPGQDPLRPVLVKIDGSGFHEAMPSHAAGIVISCIALSYLHQMGSEPSQRYCVLLRDYFSRLAAADQISRALQGLY